MKKLSTKKMKDLLKEGLILSKCYKHGPNDETFISLINRNKDGWHYQVEWLKDSRFYKKPRITVYAWRPNSGFGSSYADYYLFKEVRDK